MARTQLIGVSEAAEWLGISPITLRRWIALRKVPAVRLSRRVLLREPDIEKIIQDRTVPAEATK